MGWEIVRCEHRRNPGKWSRLWLSDDILQVLKENTGADKVEGIMLNEARLNANAFSNMNKLGLLKICNVHLPAGLGYLSNELHLMEWHEYPLISMPNNFKPDNLVKLIMPRCHFEQLPKGFSEPIQHGKGFLSSLPVTLIPKWFYNQKYGSSVSIPLPPDLSKNSSWRGIALYTGFEVEKNLGNVSPGQKSHNMHKLI
ncbi:hypothetical protein I3843_16G016300 [Carya illinoinensis]|nr:hypothetical protein I3843_16G016300 [Carya illinoinensis]